MRAQKNLAEGEENIPTSESGPTRNSNEDLGQVTRPPNVPLLRGV